MPAVVRARVSLRNAMLEKVREALSDGSVDLLFGTFPAAPEEPLFGQLLLVTLQLDEVAGPPVAAGVFEITPVADGEAQSDWSPEPPDPELNFVLFARFYDAAGENVLDVDAGLVGTDATLKLSSLTFVQGEPVRAETWTLSL